MSAKIIDGKQIAAQVTAKVAEAAAGLAKELGRPVGLAVVLVGEDPASQVYVRNKGKQTVEAGMRSIERRLPAETTQAELLALVEELNKDDTVDGILVQFPVPAHINQDAVINAIDPAKDVDGLHPINAGRLASGKPGLVSCTPYGCLLLAKTVHESLSGLDVVVVGRSNLVGKPAAQLFLAENATVTVAHSRTRDLPAVVGRADIVVAAVGRPLMIKGEWIKPGATVIDVGINRIERDGKAKLVGDVHYDSAAAVAGAITPVPGGVGPMTIACLLANTLTACCRANGLEEPKGLTA